MLCNRKEIADIFGINEYTVDAWAKEGMPKALKTPGKEVGDSRKKFNSVECIKWYSERVSTTVEPEKKSKYDYNAEKSRLMHHQANNEALKEKVALGELVKVEEVINKWSQASLSMRNKLLTLPSRIAKISTTLNNEIEIQLEVENQIHQALNELSIYHTDTIEQKPVPMIEQNTE